MAANSAQPVILPMSNPTAICEGDPQHILDWSDGKALVATGSPFAPVEVEGGLRRIGQANNVFVFPGIGLGAIVSGASEITGTMIAASSRALAETLSDDEMRHQCLMPEVSRLWEICGYVALAVAQQAVDDGVSTNKDVGSLQAQIEEYRWKPVYPEIVTDDL
jgi:malate dehydrogenase (oxaloacetate-decarboxylating)